MLLSLLVAVPLALVLVARGRAWTGLVVAAAAGLATWALTGPGTAAEVMARPEWRAAAALSVLAAAVWGLPPLRRIAFTKRALARDAARLEHEPPHASWVEPTEAERWFAAGRPAQALRSSEPRALEFAIPGNVLEALDEVLASADPADVRRAGGLPQELWSQAARAGLLGLGMPPESGGRGLTPAQLSTVVTRTSSRCLELGEVLAMSGPGGFADVVARFGSSEQREELLPVFGRGEVLGALSWTGVPTSVAPRCTVVRREVDGEETLGLELEARFDGVELAPVAGIVAVLVETHDPDGLLERGERPGNTCVLVRAGAEGLENAGHHRTIGSFTAAGPVEVQDLFVPLSDVLGGEGAVGRGDEIHADAVERAQAWAVPALASGVLQSALLASSAHAQLHLRPSSPGTELARLAAAASTVESLRTGLAHLLSRAGEGGPARPGRSLAGAARVACAAAVQDGLRAARTALGRAASFHGSHNVTEPWTGVETRLATLFGEADGAEHGLSVDRTGAQLMALDGLALADAARAGDLAAYDRSWSRRSARGASLWCRSVLRSAARLLPFPLPAVGSGLTGRLDDAGLAFAAVSDAVARRIHGIPENARPEVSRSLGRALASLLGAACAAQLHRVRGEQPMEQSVLDETLHTRLEETEDALDRVATLLSASGAARTLSTVVARLTRPGRRGRLAARVRVAEDLLHTRDLRTRLSSAAFVPHEDEPGLGVLEKAAALSYAARAPLARMEQAMRDGQLTWGPLLGALDEAVQRGLVSKADRDNVLACEHSLEGFATFETSVGRHSGAA